MSQQSYFQSFKFAFFSFPGNLEIDNGECRMWVSIAVQTDAIRNL